MNKNFFHDMYEQMDPSEKAENELIAKLSQPKKAAVNKKRIVFAASALSFAVLGLLVYFMYADRPEISFAPPFESTSQTISSGIQSSQTGEITVESGENTAAETSLSAGETNETGILDTTLPPGKSETPSPSTQPPTQEQPGTQGEAEPTQSEPPAPEPTEQEPTANPSTKPEPTCTEPGGDTETTDPPEPTCTAQPTQTTIYVPLTRATTITSETTTEKNSEETEEYLTFPEWLRMFLFRFSGSIEGSYRPPATISFDGKTYRITSSAWTVSSLLIDTGDPISEITLSDEVTAKIYEIKGIFFKKYVAVKFSKLSDYYLYIKAN